MASGVKTYPALLPLSWLYSMAIKGRNLLFDAGVLPEETFPLPVITVGNLAVGGTGKTPHVEHLIRLLQDRHAVAVLSRGYRRRTKGFVLASPHSTAADIGDEPLQMHRKFPAVTVAVDADRRHGIRQLLEQETPPSVILLDDAYQHRYVKAGLRILLTDYRRRFSRDLMLPAGRLREPRSGKRRADIVVVTKCPSTLSEDERQAIARELALDNRQALFFSRIEYAPIEPLGGGAPIPLDTLGNHHLLLLTGIANPAPMEEALGACAREVTTMRFADHHNYTPAEMERVAEAFDRLPEPRLLVTTEKDAARLADTGLLPKRLGAHTCTLPIHIRFLFGQEGTFDQKIIDFVQEGSPTPTAERR